MYRIIVGSRNDKSTIRCPGNILYRAEMTGISKFELSRFGGSNLNSFVNTRGGKPFPVRCPGDPSYNVTVVVVINILTRSCIPYVYILVSCRGNIFPIRRPYHKLEIPIALAY